MTEPLTSPRYFYTLGYRLAQAYGLEEQPIDPLYKSRLAWFAHQRTHEQVEVYIDSVIVRIEGGETHRLVISD